MSSYEDILGRMLALVPSDIDTRVGSVAYNQLAPVAVELALAYERREEIKAQTYADTATGDDLTRRAAERGINRKEATKAIRKGVFNTKIPIGTRFSISNTTYTTIARINETNELEYEYKLEAEQPGTVGNAYSGDLLPIDFVEGLTSAKITDIILPGDEGESDTALRNRYYDSFGVKSFGGNVMDYKNKVNSLAGVGGTKVNPCYNGGGTVQLIIVDSNYKKPTDALVSNVKEAIDPENGEGQGYGIAPIGHAVDVQGAIEKVINFQSDISLRTGYTWSGIKDDITEVIEDYLNGVNETWSSGDELVVRIAQIETKILAVTGVLDITNTKLNNAENNITLGINEIAVLGQVVNNA